MLGNAAGTLHDEVHACLRVDGTALRLELDWALHDRDRSITNKSTIVVKRGETFELAHAGAKLAVAVQ